MPSLSELTQTHKALAHPARLRVLAILRGGELCACQITAVLGLAPSTVSAHLAELRRAGLVDEQKAGRWVLYRLADTDRAVAVLEPLWQQVRNDPQMRSEKAIVKRLRTVSLEQLCSVDLDLAQLAIIRAGGGRL
ncbi:MAG: winged helix-turn-helix transcriptional regulator [Gemmatimonadota bacterium]|nr:MAG: winged helix-turn-helix transcriptional regulator [Gemmatimonadota bacterium]